jgi:ATPase subunit of ABC transporter with duplicated ATPase domains
MKAKTFFLSALVGTFIFISSNTFAQTATDSVKISNGENQLTKERQDQRRLHNAEDLKRDTRASANQAKANVKETKANAKEAKARAKEADRIEDDASDAARQAKVAVRTESKAQKSRDKADKQARKAAKATEKSNNN